ncbi:hypothetical protein pb186bvf_011095 [Paramecium bursaria]
MQINGRLQLQVTLESKDYNFRGNINMVQETDSIDKQAEEIAQRIMQKVKVRSQVRSQARSSNKQSTDYLKIQTDLQMPPRPSEAETVKAKQIHIETQPVDMFSPQQIFPMESPQPLQSSAFQKMTEMQTPHKSKSQQDLHKHTRKHSTIKKQGQPNYFLIPEQKHDGKQLIKMMQKDFQLFSDDVHTLVKRSATTTSLSQKLKPQSPTRKDTKSPNRKDTKQNTVFAKPPQQFQKSDIVTQLLGSLRNAKKLKDEYTKRFL